MHNATAVAEAPHPSTLPTAGPDALTGNHYNRDTLVNRLRELGWLEPSDPARRDSDDVVRAVLSVYQRQFGIAPTGVLDPRTERSLREVRFCHHPDVMAIQDEPNRWPTGMVVTWNLDKPFPGMTLDQSQDVYRWAASQWSAVCGISLQFNPNPKTAQITASVGPIDGPASVLGWSQLADGMMTPKQQLFDAGEAWCFADMPAQFTVDAGRVVGHELGHSLGIPHIEAGNWLQPMYDLGIRGPKAGDIREAQARYGPPGPKAPDPIPAGAFTLTLTAKELIALNCTGFDIRKL